MGIKKHKLIVLFPLYNGAKSVEKSLQCIADQTFQDFQAIIVENHSTDGSLQIAQNFAEKDHRFQVVQNEAHVGPMENFSNAVEKYQNQAQYICLRAHDDFSSEDFLEKLIEALEKDPSKALAVCASHRIKPGEAGYVVEHDPRLFDFQHGFLDRNAPRRLRFPSDWFYGVYRSGVGTEIFLRRLPMLGTPWGAASCVVAEFILRGLAVFVDGPHFEFHWISDSAERYTVKSRRERLWARITYTSAIWATRKHMGKLTLSQKIRLAQIGWRDAKRKLGYS